MSEEKIRSLEEVCSMENLSIKLVDIVYCGVAPTNRIRCEYQEGRVDHNEMHRCTNPFHQYSDSVYKVKQ